MYDQLPYLPRSNYKISSSSLVIPYNDVSVAKGRGPPSTRNTSEDPCSVDNVGISLVSLTRPRRTLFRLSDDSPTSLSNLSIRHRVLYYNLSFLFSHQDTERK